MGSVRLINIVIIIIIIFPGPEKTLDELSVENDTVLFVWDGQQVCTLSLFTPKVSVRGLSFSPPIGSPHPPFTSFFPLPLLLPLHDLFTLI